MIDYIDRFICIATSVIYIIISLLIGQEASVTLVSLIYIMIISYVLGLILKVYLKRNVFPPEDDSPQLLQSTEPDPVGADAELFEADETAEEAAEEAEITDGEE